ncbi:MAG TPA: L-threonylcarbamoyladenylate synthase [Anaeromyxobacteraceae bacterium]|nr:L-threonylcarbamoyladenylate synthase [Anaeromyxobacteraceae bacterium]
MALVTRDVAEVASALRRGGLAVYPTETFYGLGALARDVRAIGRLAASKLRPPGKPLPLVAADVDMAFGVWAGVPKAAAALAARFWPGPLTIVCAAAPGLPAEVGGGGTVGVRVPGSPVARELARLSGGALVSTSANVSGGPPVTRVSDLDPAIVAAVDAVLDGGPVPGGLPSTVVAVKGDALSLVRSGAVPWEDVVAVAAHPALPSGEG